MENPWVPAATLETVTIFIPQDDVRKVISARRPCSHAMSSGMAHFALKCNKTNYACRS
jgi:hypothetical protein